jgi:NAD-dependent deacetylase
MNIVVFSGAGISMDSGIPSMDDPKSIFMKYPESITQKDAWKEDWETFKKFWDELKAFILSPSIQPNDAHKDLVKLENLIDGKLTIITTNIDDLHTKAGSKNVLHIHGIITQDRKIEDNRSFPNCVLFGEGKRFTDEANKAIENANLFVSIGSSLATNDLSTLMHAKNSGARTIEINPNPTWYSDKFDEVIRLPASEGLQDLINNLNVDI